MDLILIRIKDGRVKKMKKINILLLISFLSIQTLWAQVTFVVNQLPENHDYTKPIYISGDFEGWSGGNETYKRNCSEKFFIKYYLLPLL